MKPNKYWLLFVDCWVVWLTFLSLHHNFSYTHSHTQTKYEWIFSLPFFRLLFYSMTLYYQIINLRAFQLAVGIYTFLRLCLKNGVSIYKTQTLNQPNGSSLHCVKYCYDRRDQTPTGYVLFVCYSIRVIYLCALIFTNYILHAFILYMCMLNKNFDKIYYTYRRFVQFSNPYTYKYILSKPISGCTIPKDWKYLFISKDTMVISHLISVSNLFIT